MLREAHAALSINHPNVVRVLDLNDGASGPVFVVMEALVGNALGDLLRRGPARRAPSSSAARSVAVSLRRTLQASCTAT